MYVDAFSQGRKQEEIMKYMLMLSAKGESMKKKLLAKKEYQQRRCDKVSFNQEEQKEK